MCRNSPGFAVIRRRESLHKTRFSSSVCPVLTVSSRGPVGLPVGIDSVNDMLKILKHNFLYGQRAQTFSERIASTLFSQYL
jgi:hypothetical protein